MQNEFEKKVQLQMEQFEVAPAEAVWQKVEARIRKEKKRRRILFYWVPAAMFLIAGGAYFFTTMDNEKKVFADKKQDKAIPKQSFGMRALIPEEKQTPNTATYYKAKKLATSNSNLITGSKRTNHYDKNYKKEVIAATMPVNRKDGGEKKTADVDNKSLESESKKNEDKPTAVSKTVEIIKQEQSLKDTNAVRNSITAEKKVLAIADTSLVIKPLDKKVPVTIKPISKKVHWGVTLYTGISNNINALIGLPSAASFDRFSSPSQVTGSVSSYYPVTDHFKLSFSFGAGVFMEKNISKRISITTGINYHSYAVKLSVGQRVDSASSIRDSSLDKSVSVNSFYRPGEASFYKNRFHLLELPVNMQWQLNRNTAKPLQLLVGFTPGVLIASNALYYNPYQRFYYREKDQLRNFQVALQAGLMFTVSQSAKYRLQLGPSLKYNVTNLTKTEVLTTEHLFFFGLKTSLLFKK